MIESPDLSESRHCIGLISGQQPGPTFVAMGGLHGNEPAGVKALERVVGHLQKNPTRFMGRLVALAGNLEALDQGRRFIARDLNRVWTPDRIEELRATDSGVILEHEDRVQKDLLGLMDQILQWSNQDFFLVDLHTTSAPGSPFCVINDRLENRKFVSHFPLPLVLGLEEELVGTLADFVGRDGHVSAGFEGGQHDSSRAVDQLEAILWVALVAVGNLRETDCPQVRSARERLAEASCGVPSIVEVQHRHTVCPQDQFRMEPGFSNFQEIRAGQILARDRTGELKAPYSVRLLMPLYQTVGEEGFILVQEVKPFWLKCSAWLHRLGPEKIIHWLPGVEPHPREEGAFLVDTKVARWLALQFFHLMGFRKYVSRDGLLLVRRRE